MIYLLTNLFLMAPAGEEGAEGGGGGMMTLIFFGAMFLILYFFMIRPQVRKAKRTREFQAGIQKGDSVVTAGGIHGKVAKLNEDGTTLLIEVDSGVKLKVEKSVISMEQTSAKK